MGRSKKIRTVADVFAHFCATYDPKDATKHNEMLSRRLYKDTHCGAWGRVEYDGYRDVGHRDEVWTATFTNSLFGYVLTGLRRAHARKVEKHRFSSSGTLAGLETVRDFLDVGYRNRRWLFQSDPQSLRDTKVGNSIKRVVKRGKDDYQIVVTFSVKAPVRKHYAGVFFCGSIVEGVDAEANADPVYLPCTAADLDDAVAFVEKEADRIWSETHGCEECNPSEGVGGKVNPDCKGCSGDGVTI